MEAWKDEPRVRPIPIADGETSEVGFTAPEPPDEPPRRPWLPLILSAVAVVVIIGSIATFGAVEDDDPVLEGDTVSVEGETTSTSTTTTIALRTLEETVPGLTSRLTLIAQGADGPTALLWDPSFVQPRAFPIEYNPAHTARFALDDAAFDASGDFVRILGHDITTKTAWMWVGSPTDVAAVDIPDVLGGAVWHAHDVHHLAWVTAAPNGEDSQLHTARLNPLSLELQSHTPPVGVPDGSQLVRWDAEGFVLASPSGTITALDPAGTVTWQTNGDALGASDSTILVAHEYTAFDEDEDGEPDFDPIVTYAVAVDRDGDETGVVLDEIALPGATHRSLWITSSTDYMAQVDVRGQSTTLEASGGDLVAVRKLRQNDDVLPLGFVHNDSYFTFASDGGNDLIFVNWNLGGIHELAVPDGFKVVGFTTG